MECKLYTITVPESIQILYNIIVLPPRHGALLITNDTHWLLEVICSGNQLARFLFKVIKINKSGGSSPITEILLTTFITCIPLTL